MQISRVLWHASEALANGDIEGASFYNSQKEGGIMDSNIEALYEWCMAWESCLVADDVDNAVICEDNAKAALATINKILADSEELATQYGADVADVIGRFPMLEG